MASTANIVERVADRHVKRLTGPLEAALQRARGRLSEGALVSALDRGRAAAMRLVDDAVEDGDLRVLAAKEPMTERLLDVAEESADATRCITRPTTSRPTTIRQRAKPAATDVQLHNELSVGQVEQHLRAPARLPGTPASPAPTRGQVWPVVEDEANRDLRLRRGYTEIARVDAKQFAADYERTQGQALAWQQRRTEALRDVAELDSYPQVAVSTDAEGKTIVNVVDGRHRIGLAAERQQLIDVAMTPESRASAEGRVWIRQRPATPTFKPVMSQVEADAWAADSTFRQPVNHRTTAPLSAFDDGIKIIEQKFGGAMYGEGVYTSTVEEGTYGPNNVRIKVRMTNPLQGTRRQLAEEFERLFPSSESDYLLPHESYAKELRRRIVAAGYDGIVVDFGPNREQWIIIIKDGTAVVIR